MRANKSRIVVVTIVIARHKICTVYQDHTNAKIGGGGVPRSCRHDEALPRTHNELHALRQS